MSGVTGKESAVNIEVAAEKVKVNINIFVSFYLLFYIHTNKSSIDNIFNRRPSLQVEIYG